MMSQESLWNLKFVDPVFADLLRGLSAEHDFVILSGYRGPREQSALHSRGHSEHAWPDSAHNRIPSRAVDLAPAVWGGDPADLACFKDLVDAIAGAAKSIGRSVEWRGAAEPWHLEIV